MVSVLHGGLGGDVDYISISWTGVDKVDSEEVRRELLKSRGGTQTDTGYLMWFGGQEHLRLSVADMKGILEPYAVPESGLESLPVHARSLLEESGNLQFLGSYDPDAGVFENVVVDWREQRPGSAWQSCWSGTNSLSTKRSTTTLSKKLSSTRPPSGAGFETSRTSGVFKRVLKTWPVGFGGRTSPRVRVKTEL